MIQTPSHVGNNRHLNSDNYAYEYLNTIAQKPMRTKLFFNLHFQQQMQYQSKVKPQTHTEEAKDIENTSVPLIWPTNPCKK